MGARGVDRITARFAAVKREGRGALVTYVMAGDPDPDTSRAIVAALPEAGADVIELGMPFTDPMADGPAIQLAGQRALAAGMTSAKVLDIVRDFRRTDETTPLILMGYFNPIFVYGAERFVRNAAEAGVDGLLIVDLPPEEEGELKPALASAGLALIRLATPTTDEKRLPAVLASATGFLYFVSITGITGGRTAELTDISPHLTLIRKHTDLPVAVGFGIKTGENVRAICAAADGAVVGTAIVNEIAASLDQAGRPGRDTLERVTAFVGNLAAGTK